MPTAIVGWTRFCGPGKIHHVWLVENVANDKLRASTASTCSLSPVIGGIPTPLVCLVSIRSTAPMRISFRVIASLALFCPTAANAFTPNANKSPFVSRGALSATSTSKMVSVATEPIPGMLPGTSGLRKKVEVWKDTPNYVENFIQALLDTATAKNSGKVPQTYVDESLIQVYDDSQIGLTCGSPTIF